MEIASIIFIILGIITNALISPWWFWIIGTICGIFAIYSISKNDKNTAIGILSLLFTSLLGGVFYLCWSPKEHKEN